MTNKDHHGTTETEKLKISECDGPGKGALEIVMKQIGIVLMMWGVIGFGVIPVGYAQDALMLISSEELGEHQRPVVRYPHEKHMEDILCARCHHDYDEFGGNTDEDGQRCADCHTAAPSENPIPLMKAFHMQCKGCHEKLAGTGRYDLPRTCGRCHVRPDSGVMADGQPDP